MVPYRKRKPSNIIRIPLYSIIIYIKYKTFLPTPVTQHIEIPRQITCVSHARVCTFLRVRSSYKTYSICITVWLLFVFKRYTFYMHRILYYTLKKCLHFENRNYTRIKNSILAVVASFIRQTVKTIFEYPIRF